MSSKVYTKTGDKGRTSLLGGARVSKSNLRIEAYGNVDELNSFLGHLHDHDLDESIRAQLFWLQNKLFNVGSILAIAPGFSGFELPKVTDNDTQKLENWIDHFEENLPELKNFILPSGHKIVSLCHVCRSVCRRTERSVSALGEEESLDECLLPFINRLSDYLFVLSRRLTQDFSSSEVHWKPE